MTTKKTTSVKKTTSTRGVSKAMKEYTKEVAELKPIEEATEEKKAVVKKAPAKKAPAVAKKTEPATTKKAPAKKAVAKKEAPEAKANNGNFVEAQKLVFPMELDLEGEKLQKLDFDITYERLAKLIADEHEVYFVGRWTKQEIKVFDYEGARLVKVPKKGFPNNLDIMLAIYVCETIPRIFTISQYTEALFMFTDDDLELVMHETVKQKFRLSAGLFYDIYVKPETYKELYTESIQSKKKEVENNEGKTDEAVDK